MAKADDNRHNDLIKVGMKTLLGFGTKKEGDTEQPLLTLTSFVEEVSDKNTILIQWPIHKGEYYHFLPNERFNLRLISDHTVYNVTVKFLNRVVEDNMVYANLQIISPIKSGQLRSCYRLPCFLDVFVRDLNEETSDEAEELRVFEGKIRDISTGGMQLLTNEHVKSGEQFILDSDIELIDNINCKVLRTDHCEPSGIYKYKVAIQFINMDTKQQNKLYKYIVKQQLEKRRQLSDNKPKSQYNMQT